MCQASLCCEGCYFGQLKPRRLRKLYKFLMVSVQDALAVELGKIHIIKAMDNFTPSIATGDSKTKEETMNGLKVADDSQETSTQFSSLEGVCQTAGFINSQNQQGKFPGSVRFVVQPVPEDEIRSEVGPQDGEESHQHSAQFFTFLSTDASADDINGPYSISFISPMLTVFLQIKFQFVITGFGGSDPQAQLTVRSMASIGLGSSNGRKIHLRRVHTTGADLVTPLLVSSNGETIQTQWSFPTLT